MLQGFCFPFIMREWNSSCYIIAIAVNEVDDCIF
nr:MAG TPA: hypothetical protein [Caudoviricetes sp.]